MKTKPKPPTGYRMLKAGEMMVEGQLVFVEGKWTAINPAIQPYNPRLHYPICVPVDAVKAGFLKELGEVRDKLIDVSMRLYESDRVSASAKLGQAIELVQQALDEVGK